MNTSFKSRLLQHFIKAKQNKSGGFTLIELLVVIIIIGILAAIALPSFLNQANKAKQSEAKTYIGTTNRTQQAYRLENPTFSDDFAKLGAGIQTKTTNYTYGSTSDKTTVAQGTTAPLATDLSDGVKYFAAAEDEAALKDFAGAAYLIADSTTGDASATAVLCEENSVSSGLADQEIDFTGVTKLGQADASVSGDKCTLQ